MLPQTMVFKLSIVMLRYTMYYYIHIFNTYTRNYKILKPFFSYLHETKPLEKDLVDLYNLKYLRV
jgi:hypothetical protein